MRNTVSILWRNGKYGQKNLEKLEIREAKLASLKYLFDLINFLSGSISQYPFFGRRKVP